MNKATAILTLSLKAAGLALLVAAMFAVLEVRHLLRDFEGVGTVSQVLTANVDRKLNGKGGTIDSLNETIAQVNDVVARLNKNDGAVKEAAGTLGEATSALKQVSATVTDVRTLLMRDDGILDNVNKAAKDVRINLAQVSRAQTKYYTEDAPAMTKLITDADKLLSEPQITASLSNIESSTANIADLTKHTDEMAVDFEGSLHSHLHPTRTALFFSGLWQVAKIAATHVP